MTRNPTLQRWLRIFQAAVEKQPILFFTLMALALIWVGQIGDANRILTTGFLRDTDDATRLVEIRDFLGGQNWFDLHQYRMNPPDGVLMHWSRLIDAPVAGLILFFKLFASQDMAERIARLVFPALLQAGFMAGLIMITWQLAGRVALLPAAIIVGFGWILSSQFEPGRIDHHSAMMVLSTLTLACLLAKHNRAAMACLAGCLSAFSAAIGFEALPVCAISGLYLFVLWFFDRPDAGRQLRSFGIGLAISTLLLYGATTPRHLYFTVFCDAQSYLSTLAMCLSGLIAFVLASLSSFLNTRLKKSTASVLAMIPFAACLYGPLQQCARGPFSALPPDIVANWLEKVVEAKPITHYVMENFWGGIPFMGPLLVGILCVLAVFVFQSASERWRWGLPAALMLAFSVLTFQHLRFITYAALFGVPACAWCIARLRERSEALMAIVYIACIPAAWALANNYFGDPPPAAKTACNTPANFTALASLPAGSVLAPVDFGPYLLAYTPHGVFGAPYHRNVEGLQFSYGALYHDTQDAVAKIKQKKPHYIALCDGLGELNGIQKSAPDTLAARLLRKDTIPGLVPASLDQPIMIWKVDYSALAAR